MTLRSVREVRYARDDPSLRRVEYGRDWRGLDGRGFHVLQTRAKTRMRGKGGMSV